MRWRSNSSIALSKNCMHRRSWRCIGSAGMHFFIPAEEHLSPWFEWDTPPGGMFVWMRAKTGPEVPAINTSDLYHYAVDEKVAFRAEQRVRFRGTLTTAMRVNFTRSSPEVIAEGVRRLRRAVERYLTSNSRKSAGAPTKILVSWRPCECPHASRHRNKIDCRKSRLMLGAS